MVSCKKKTDDNFDNPFDSYTAPPLYDTPDLTGAPESNFAYLHQAVFAPTCANSGCHDGAFEPDFRTITSSYNSLVYHPVITNNQNNTFTYRVNPGDATTSLMHERLINALPNTSGIMPPTYADEWIVNKTKHIQAIKDWINDGAKDMFGNNPTIGNFNPQAVGFHAYPDGNTTTIYTRAPGAGVTPIVVPSGNVDLWFAFSDDQTTASSLQVNEVKISTKMYDFTNATTGVMSLSSSISSTDFTGNNITFTHKYDLNTSIYPSGTILFVRVYVKDADHQNPVEIPGQGTAKNVLHLFTLYVN